MISAEGLAQISRALRDPLKKKVLAKDETIIGGLILILSNPDKSIVIEALEIFLSLAAPVEDRLFLREFLGMLDELNSLAHENNALDHIREKARQLISRLNSEDAVSTQSALLKQRSSNLPCVNQMNLRGAKNFSKPLFNMSKCRTITLEIEGLNDKTDMETCRERLLTVKGVVSITFDLPRKRSIIRVKPEISPNRLASAIDQSNVMLARQVVRTDAGEEKVVDLRQTCSVSTHKDNKNKENAHPPVLPAYLPEEDSPVKVDDRAVRRYGTKDEDVGAGWLGAAASFLAKSFYW